MRGLDFEHAAQAQRPDPNRVDIACFVGFVARREGALPASVRAELARARWTDGPWARPAAEVECGVHVLWVSAETPGEYTAGGRFIQIARDVRERIATWSEGG